MTSQPVPACRAAWQPHWLRAGSCPQPEAAAGQARIAEASALPSRAATTVPRPPTPNHAVAPAAALLITPGGHTGQRRALRAHGPFLSGVPGGNPRHARQGPAHLVQGTRKPRIRRLYPAKYGSRSSATAKASSPGNPDRDTAVTPTPPARNRSAA